MQRSVPGTQHGQGRGESSHRLIWLLASLLFLSHRTFRSQISLVLKHMKYIPTPGPLHYLLPQ